ncbi:MAG TPA: toll/interleukin-1 receptor domain-containing protein [Pyrinomonadaceae bacterium]
MSQYKVFISHGSEDLWLARQVAKEIQAVGGFAFLDESNIPKGSPNFKNVIREEISSSKELIALFTPWSATRSWVWIEIGAAWSRDIPILAVFHGLQLTDLDQSQGKAILDDINVIRLNEFDRYLGELSVRIKRLHK